MFEYTSLRASVEVSVAGFFVTLFFVFSSSFVMNAGLRAAAEIITKRARCCFDSDTTKNETSSHARPFPDITKVE